jgi:hypothetical protein
VLLSLLQRGSLYGYQIIKELETRGQGYFRLRVEVFEAFFNRTVELCQQASLVRGEAAFFDSTLIQANASVRRPRPASWLCRPRAQQRRSRLDGEETGKQRPTDPLAAQCMPSEAAPTRSATPIQRAGSFSRRLDALLLRHRGEPLDLLQAQTEPLGYALTVLRVRLVEEGGLSELNAFLGVFQV